jgi:hypothetical protein
MAFILLVVLVFMSVGAIISTNRIKELELELAAEAIEYQKLTSQYDELADAYRDLLTHQDDDEHGGEYY